MPTEQATIYVAVEMGNAWPPTETDWPQIKLYADSQGQEPTDGSITVGSGGAMISFQRLPGTNAFWNFWNITLHPLGSNTDVVDIDWCLDANQAVIRDTSSARRARTFSYTLALQTEDGYKLYLDPKLVNTGGGSK